MAWKVDALDLEAGTSRHLHVHDAEGNGNAGASLEDFVQKAVAGVLIVVDVPGEFQLVEEEVIQREHLCVPIGVHPRRGVGLRRDRRGAKAKTSVAPECIQLIEIGANVERGIFDLRDQQRGHRHTRIGAQRGMREAADD